MTSHSAQHKNTDGFRFSNKLVLKLNKTNSTLPHIFDKSNFLYMCVKHPSSFQPETSQTDYTCFKIGLLIINVNCNFSCYHYLKQKQYTYIFIHFAKKNTSLFNAFNHSQILSILKPQDRNQMRQEYT